MTTTAAKNLVYLGGTYSEAMDLLVEARDYVAGLEPGRRLNGMAPLGGLIHCLETLRLTARLTQIMAWLLAQRAVHAGELEPGEALAEPLTELDVCMGGAERENSDLPPDLSDLLGRSRHLYLRVARLDALARRNV